MPESHRPGDRSVAQRQADHAGLARLSESLVPGLVGKLNAGGLGELEVREGDWHIRLRRGTAVPRRHDRPRHAATTAAPAAAPPATAAATSAPAPVHPALSTDADPADAGTAEPRQEAAVAPAVGIFKPGSAVGAHVRAGDRVAVVDMLGIPQDVVAPIDGTVVEFYPQAGDGVEYGEELVLIEAAPEPGPAAAGEG
jgi:biotin carboxyl carrier protein